MKETIPAQGSEEKENRIRRQILIPLGLGLLVSVLVVLALCLPPLIKNGSIPQPPPYLILLFLGALGLTAAAVFAFIYLFLGRVQRELFARRSALLNEIDTREEAETALRKLKEDLERQVAERTSALEKEIEERRRAEDDARVAWNDLQQIFNASGCGMLLLNLARLVIRANQAAALLLTRPLAEIPGCNCHDFFACGLSLTPHCCVKKILAGAAQAECEVEVKRNDGRQTWVMLTSTPLFDAKGRLIGVVQNFQDITKRKETEEELRQAKEEWEETFNAMDEIVTLQDQEMRIIRANRAAGKFLGLKPEELIGRHCYELFRGAGEPCPGCPELETIKNGLPHASEIEHTGLGKTLLVSASPVLDKNGVCRTLIHVAKDITAQKEFAAKLQQARKIEAVGTLAAGVAHDFNNILTGVLGYGEMSLRATPQDSPMRENLAQIIAMGKRGAGLTRQLLAFSRKQIMEPRLINLNELVANLMKMLDRLLGADIEISFTPTPDSSRIMADPGQMEQVLVNLAVNARDAMPKGGMLSIETSNVTLGAEQAACYPGIKPGPHLILAVSDTGIGMDRETKEHIFEPFFTTKDVGQGTGLGLATVHGIIQQHRGGIWVYSEPGQGSVFKIILPLASGHETHHAEDQAGQGFPRGRESIILAEDDDAVRLMLSQALSELGYTVFAAKNPAEALRHPAVGREKIALLLSDMIMPGGNGLELYQRLAAKVPGLKVLFMSGYSEAIMEQKNMELAGMPFLQKPFTSIKIARAVRRALDA